MDDVNENRELIAEARKKAEWYGNTDLGPIVNRLADALEASTPADAATEREVATIEEHREKWMARAFRAETERDAALVALERVRAIHTPLSSLSWGAPEEFQVCEECNDPDARGFIYWPCATIQALDGAPEPEVLPVDGGSK